MAMSEDPVASARSIRLLIVDRQPIVLQGLKSVFASQAGFEIVASCGDRTGCLEAIRNSSPDIALVADNLPDLTPSEIMAIAKAENLSTRLVFFTESGNSDDLTAAIADGACSALSRYANPDSMLRSLRLMTERSGLPELSASGKEGDSAKIEKMLGSLTQRERQIVRLVSDGLSNKEIARKLKVSDGTVKVHLHNIFQKLEINNRTVLATIALLQRQAGFGTLALAALAFVLADDLKASDANDLFPDDDGLDHSGFEPWKKAILRHAFESGEKILPPQTGSAALVGHVAHAAARVEPFRAAEQTVLPVPGRGHVALGSSTPPPSTSAFLQAVHLSQGGSATAPPVLPLPFVSNMLKAHGGYGIFTMLAGAWIYALDQSHAAAPSPGSDDILVDSSIVVRDGAIQVATSPGHREFASWADKINLTAFGALAFLHLTSASQSVPPHTLAWIYDPASRETIVFVNLTSRSLDIGDAGLLEFHLEGDASAAGSEPAAVAVVLEEIDAALFASTADESIVLATYDGHASVEVEANESALGTANLWRASAADGLRFHFARDRIGSNTSAHLKSSGRHSADTTEESDSAAGMPAHASSIEIADSNATSPAEINLSSTTESIRGNSNASSVGQGNAHAVAGFETSALAAQSVAIAALIAAAGQAETAPGNSAGHSNSQHFADTSSATEATTGQAETAPGNSAAHSSVQHAAEPASVTEATTGQAETAPGNSAGHSNSQHAAGQASATEAAAEQSETSPGNSAGRGNSQHAAGQASVTVAGAEQAEIAPGNSASRGNSQHAAEPASATVAAAEEAETAPGNSAGHGNSQHAAEPASATVAAIEENETAPGNSASRGNSQHAAEPASATVAAVEEAETAPGNSAGHGNSQRSADASSVTEAATGQAETAPGNSASRGNSQHAAEPASATVAAIEENETAPGNSASRGNSQHAAEPASATVAATEEAETAPGNSAGRGNSQHAAEPASVTEAAAGQAETAPGNSAGHGNSQHVAEPTPVTVAATEENETAPGNSAGRGNSQHAAEPASVTEAATEQAETAPGNSAGQGNSQHAAEPAAAMVTAAEQAETGPGNSASHSNSQNAAEPAPATVAAAEEAETAPDNSAGHGNSQNVADQFLVAMATEEVEIAPGNSAGRGNSQHVAEAAPVTVLATEQVEIAPDNGAGHGNAQPAAEPTLVTMVTAGEAEMAPGNSAGHGNSQNVADQFLMAMATEEVAAAPGNSAGHGNSQHVAEAAPVTVPATEQVEIVPDNGAGRGNSQPAAEPAPATVAAAEQAETAPGNSAGRGNSQNVSQASTSSKVAQPTDAMFDIGGAGDATFNFDNLPPLSPTVASVELDVPNASTALFSPIVQLASIPDVVPTIVEPHAANHANNGHGHSAASSHDLLI